MCQLCPPRDPRQHFTKAWGDANVVAADWECRSGKRADFFGASFEAHFLAHQELRRQSSFTMIYPFKHWGQVGKVLKKMKNFKICRMWLWISGLCNEEAKKK